jgi:hypothetical protein
VVATIAECPIPGNGVAAMIAESPIPGNGVVAMITESPIPGNGVAAMIAESPIPGNGVAATIAESPIPSNGVAAMITESPIPGNGVAAMIAESPIPGNGVVAMIAESPIPGNGVAAMIAESPIPGNGVVATIAESPIPGNGVVAMIAECPVTLVLDLSGGLRNVCCAGLRREVRQFAVNVRVVPQLRRNHRNETHFHREARNGFQFLIVLSPVGDFLGIEVTGPPERFLAEQFLDEGRLGIEVEAIQGCPENNLLPPVDFGWKPLLGKEAQKVFVAKSAQLPLRVQARDEVEDLFIEEGVTHFHRRVHGHAVAFGLEQVPGQRNPRGNPDAAVEWVPLFGAIEGELEGLPRSRLVEDLAHRLAIEAELGEGKETVGVDPRVGAADGRFDAAPGAAWGEWDFIESEETAPDDLGEAEARDEIEVAECFGDFIPGVPDEPFVGAFAGENGLLAALVDAAGELKEGGAGGIHHGRLSGLDKTWVRFKGVLVGEVLNDGRFGADVAGDELSSAEFVEGRVFDRDGVGIDLPGLQVVREGDDDRGIHAAGDVGAHRDIGAEAALDGSHEDLLKTVHELFWIFFGILVAFVREVHFPVGALADAVGAVTFIGRRDLEEVAGGEEVYAFKAGGGTGDGGKGEDVIEPVKVGLGRDDAGGEQAFDFRGKKKPFALLRPIQGSDAEAIPAEEELPALIVPEGDGKLPPEFLPHGFLVVLPQVGNDLGVTVGHQAMPAFHQLRPSFDVIEEFPIKNDADGAVFIPHRLLAIREADNREASGRESEARALQIPHFIRPAVKNGAGHSFDDAFGSWTVACQVDDSCYSAHGYGGSFEESG